MRYKKVPGTDLSVSCISLGTWVFGGDECWGYSEEKDCIDTTLKAIDLGINLIDTAPIYGFGKSEEIVGKAIKGKRDKVIIATKCGLIKEGESIKTSLKPASIEKEIEESLRRLNVDCIDLYQIHWPDLNTPIEQTLATMLKLQKQGKIRYVGVSNFNLDLLKRAMQFCRIASIQNEYSFLNREAEKELLPFCIEKGIGFLAYGSLGGGILSGKYKTPPRFNPSDARSFFYKFYQGREFKKAQKLVDILNKIAKLHKKPIAQLALNWINQKEAVSSAIVGARNPRQVEENCGCTDWLLSEEEINQLDSFRF
jgi:aryl-alcohol dehydrogenase-like predicted oxidoreductase